MATLKRTREKLMKAFIQRRRELDAELAIAKNEATDKFVKSVISECVLSTRSSFPYFSEEMMLDAKEILEQVIASKPLKMKHERA